MLSALCVLLVAFSFSNSFSKIIDLQLYVAFARNFLFCWLLFPFQIPLKSILKRIDLLFFFWRFGRNFDLCLLQSNLQMTCALCSLRFAEHFFHFRFLCKKYWFEALSNLYSEKIFLTSCFIGRFWLPLCVLNVLCMCQV